MLPLLGLIIGLVIGLMLDLPIPEAWAAYITVTILVALDSLLGGLEASLRDNFRNSTLFLGFLLNLGAGLVLIALGLQLNYDLSIIVAVVFGIRIFKNLALLRRHIIKSVVRRRNRQKY